MANQGFRNSFPDPKNFIVKHRDFIAFLCIFASAIFLWWKTRFGFGDNDESFIISISLRLVRGDSLLTDEWHLSQLSAFLTYSFAKIYVVIVGSTEGIILYFRYLFVLLQVVISTTIYCYFRRYGVIAIFSALLYCLHIPLAQLMTLGYNSYSLAFVELTGLMLLSTSYKFSNIKLFFAGIFAACSVLSCPLLMFVYFSYFILVVCFEANKHKNNQFSKLSDKYFSFKTWAWITGGILVVAALFFLFLFSRTTLSDIIKNFPMMINGPEYNLGLSYGSIIATTSLLTMFMLNPALFVLDVILIAALTFDKKRLNHRSMYLICEIIIFTVYMIILVKSNKMETLFHVFWMWPIFQLGLICYILTKNKNKQLFYFVFLLGSIYSFLLDLESDTSIAAMMAMAVPNTAGVIFIKDLSVELFEEYRNNSFRNQQKNIYKMQQKSLNVKTKDQLPRYIALSLCISIIAQIGVQCFVNVDFKNIYCEYILDHAVDKTEPFDVTLKYGPQKGLKTTKYKSDLYYNTLDDLSEIKDNCSEAVLIPILAPWCYLYLDLPFATYTTYLLQYEQFDNTLSRLQDYYKFHPDKSPEYIYIPLYDEYYAKNNMQAVKMLEKFENFFDVTVKEGKEGYILRVIK